MLKNEIIKLTNAINNRKIYIDVRRIVLINLSDQGDNTYINLGNGVYTFVRESPEEILKLIEKL